MCSGHPERDHETPARLLQPGTASEDLAETGVVSREWLRRGGEESVSQRPQAEASERGNRSAFVHSADGSSALPLRQTLYAGLRIDQNLAKHRSAPHERERSRADGTGGRRAGPGHLAEGIAGAWRAG